MRTLSPDPMLARLRAALCRADLASALPLRGLHDRPAAIIRAALAEIELLQLRVVLARTLVLVVVRELHARLDAPQRVDENLPARDHGLAVRVARVIDETRVSSTRVYGTVDDGVLVEGEQERVVTLHLRVIVTPVGLVIVDGLACVLENPGPFADVANGEHAAAVDARGAHDVQRLTPVV